MVWRPQVYDVQTTRPRRILLPPQRFGSVDSLMSQRSRRKKEDVGDVSPVTLHRRQVDLPSPFSPSPSLTSRPAVLQLAGDNCVHIYIYGSTDAATG